MLTLVIQAGGQSRRMGRDKALLPFLGRPLIARLAERLAPVADELLVTTNRPEDFAFLGLPLIPDPRPGRGALGGLYAALRAARGEAVAVVACDLPFASPELLRFQAAVLEQEGADVVIPRGADGLEPLHAVYRRSACLPLVESALDAGQWQVIAWFDQARVRELRADEIAPRDPRGLAFINVNTPEEFVRAEELARGMDRGARG